MLRDFLWLGGLAWRAMNINANRVRSSSLILLLWALLNHGAFQAHDLGTGQRTSGLLRLGRDLTRRTGALVIDAARVQHLGFCIALAITSAFSFSSSFTGRCQWSLVTCCDLSKTSLSSGALAAIVEPAPTVAPAPILTGATSMLPDPMNAPSSISVGHLLAPS